MFKSFIVLGCLLLVASFILIVRLKLGLLFGKSNSQTYSCTVYYTPRESGFTKKGGFDLTPQSLESIPAREFSADFLKAVRMEGVGRLSNAIEGKKYLAYMGSWKLVDRPLGTRNKALEPMRSAALSKSGAVWKNGDWILIRSAGLPGRFQYSVWRVDDVGAGVGKQQLDLYCGEDDPSEPGEGLQRPASKNMGRVREVEVCAISDQPVLRMVLDARHFLKLYKLGL
jgi:hypothetical protein